MILVFPNFHGKKSKVYLKPLSAVDDFYIHEITMIFPKNGIYEYYNAQNFILGNILN